MKRIEVERPGAQTRREFCQQACQAASLAALGVMLPGCGGSPTAPSGGANIPALPIINATITGNSFVVNVDASSPLNAIGSAALIQASGQPFLVAHTAQDTFVALAGTCTHAQCTVSGFSGGQYVCPCHGSRYNTSGVVLSGPAPRNLAQFTTSFANGVLTVSG